MSSVSAPSAVGAPGIPADLLAKIDEAEARVRNAEAALVVMLIVWCEFWGGPILGLPLIFFLLNPGV